MDFAPRTLHAFERRDDREELWKAGAVAPRIPARRVTGAGRRPRGGGRTPAGRTPGHSRWLRDASRRSTMVTVPRRPRVSVTIRRRRDKHLCVFQDNNLRRNLVCFCHLRVSWSSVPFKWPESLVEMREGRAWPGPGAAAAGGRREEAARPGSASPVYLTSFPVISL